MLTAKNLESLVETISQNIPEGFGQMPDGLRQQFKQSLTIALQKMDLVTREEFDVQKAVLAKTRAKLEALEQQVLAMSAENAQNSQN